MFESGNMAATFLLNLSLNAIGKLIFCNQLKPFTFCLGHSLPLSSNEEWVNFLPFASVLLLFLLRYTGQACFIESFSCHVPHLNQHYNRLALIQGKVWVHAVLTLEAYFFFSFLFNFYFYFFSNFYFFRGMPGVIISTSISVSCHTI